MRENKYRLRENGKIVGYIEHKEHTVYWVKIYPDGTTKQQQTPFICYNSIEQYTGLKDKNGEELYHKDLMCNKYGNIYVIEEDLKRTGYLMKRIGHMAGSPVLDDKHEIIGFDNLGDFYRHGSIYENPDLLK